MEEKEIIIPELNNETVESMIYVIRGQKVMLDYELAKIYGYSTKRFNEQVKNNIIKFPERYRFQLNKDELNFVMSKKSTSPKNFFSGQNGGTRKLPYAFTEQGIYMLMTVLKGELATKQSIALIDAFKQMKDFIVESNNLSSIDNIIKLTNQVNSNTNDIVEIKNNLKVVMDNFINPSTYKHFLIKDGEKIEADVAYQKIYRLAKKSIYVIDDYIDVKTLQLLKCCNDNINITIITDNKGRNNLNSNYINDFKNDTNFNIIFKENNDKFHDRYIAIDFNTNNYLLYHCGASSKDSGNKINTIHILQEKDVYISLINEALNNKNLVIK